MASIANKAVLLPPPLRRVELMDSVRPGSGSGSGLGVGLVVQRQRQGPQRRSMAFETRQDRRGRLLSSERAVDLFSRGCILFGDFPKTLIELSLLLISSAPDELL